ncbi:MAG TPA: hypothetical protein VEA40_16020 [Ramlibacter sp.]|nr:hypothetical protein [Ramlibacter sp.]
MRFGFSRENAFAKELAARLVRELPPTAMADRRKVLSVNKVTRLLERTYSQVAGWQRENRAGFIRRAVLANAFRWELKGSGYPDDFIDVATEGLVVEMTKARSAAADTGA